MTISFVETLSDASGAFDAALRGNIVVVVDVINMSTTLEAALEAGALGVFGASPDITKAPVFVNPAYVGFYAGCYAKSNQTEVILVTEPRVGTARERVEHASCALAGIHKAGFSDITILPNLGAETVKICDFNKKVVLAVTDSGGVAYDAAFNAGGIVTTATIARTLRKKGLEPAQAGVQRAITMAHLKNTGISVVAASSRSLEDVLASEFVSASILSCLFPSSGRL
ncbi:hypothetical protein [Candidatus Formimonas warabiya]|uniref:hypothetical protein n=1 Tax=Formimonas warabiya TaxID=1761012 RepID=UPI001F347430|nr:hypothetical protein [Candidatus Formimonas warabiya]